MLTKKRTAGGLLLVALGLNLGSAMPALADDAPSTHTKVGQKANGESTVTTSVEIPGLPGGGGGQGKAGLAASNSTPQGGGAAEKCIADHVLGKGGPQEVSCTNEHGGSWSNEKHCYVTPKSPPPPLDDPVWQGHTDGGIYECVSIGGGGVTFWSPSAPVTVAAPPNPRQLAQLAITQLNLKGIQIGIVPEPKPGYQGAVGLPVWMWVENPSANTWGPAATSVTQSGYTVNVRAFVKDIRWDMGDGQTVTCQNSGVRYDDSFGNTASPDCGYRYSRRGTYTVTATADWEVDWEGIGQRGTLPTTTTSNVTIRIGEIQVVNQ